MTAQILMGLAIAALPYIAGGQSPPAKNSPVLQPRQPTLIVTPNRTPPASTRSDTPLQQPSTTGALPARGAAAAAADIKTEEIRCKGGPELQFEDKGSKLGPAGAGLTDLIFNIPHPNAQGIHSAAGADGAWLEEGTCAFAERPFVLGSDAHAIRYESSGPAAGNPQGQLDRPDQYWRFSVYNTGYGHFVATSHGPWRPAAARFTPKEWDSPIDGGPAGAPFQIRCDAGFYLAGVRTRVGRDLDAISPVCARMLPDGTRGDIDRRENWAGGGGGNLQPAMCPPQNPFVYSIHFIFEGADLVILNGVDVFCGRILAPGRIAAAAGRPVSAMGPDDPFNRESLYNSWDFGGFECPEGMMPAGLHGRAGWFVDALGLHCREIVGLQPKALLADLHIAGRPSGGIRDTAISEEARPIADRRGLEPAPPVSTPPPNTPPGTPLLPNDPDDAEVRISGVKINSGVRAVDFRFDARPNATPYIELSLKAPAVQANGQAKLVNAMRMKAYPEPGKVDATAARYAGSSRAQGLRLAQATTYHYVIVIPGNGKTKEQRASGSFRTRSQRAPTSAGTAGSGTR